MEVDSDFSNLRENYIVETNLDTMWYLTNKCLNWDDETNNENTDFEKSSSDYEVLETLKINFANYSFERKYDQTRFYNSSLWYH